MEAIAERRADELRAQESQPESTQRSGHSAMNLDSSPGREPFSDDLPSGPQKATAISSSAPSRERFVSLLPQTQVPHAAEMPVDMDTDMSVAQTEDGHVQADVCGTNFPTKPVQKRAFDEYANDADDLAEQGDSQETEKSFTSSLSMKHSLARREAYYQMLQNANTDNWGSIGLLSTNDSHTVMDREL